MEKKHNRGFLVNIIWKFIERCGSQGVSFVLTIILARMLEPNEFGKITLVMVFVNLFQVFAEGGLGAALIQKKDVDDYDYSTVFYFNTILSVVLYMVIYFCAPLLANFLKDDIYTPVLRIMGISILISGLRNVLISYVAKNMQFKQLSISSIIAAIVSAGVGIFLAYRGFGLWALVGQFLVNTIVSTVILWIILKWLPRRKLSMERFQQLFKFGWKVFLTNMIMTIYDDLTVLIIGKKYSDEQLGFYDQGRKFPRVIISNINTSVDSVLFSKMSDEQDNAIKLREIASEVLKMSTYVIFPIVFGLIACSTIFVPVILTEKWLPCIPYLIIFGIYYMTYPYNTVCTNAIKAVGKSGILLKIEIIKKIYEIAIIIVCMQLGVVYIALGLLVSGILNLLVNAIACKIVIGYGPLKQLKDTCFILIINLIMASIVYLISFIPIRPLFVLVIQVIVGFFIYVVLSKIFKIDSFTIIVTKIKNILKTRGNKNGKCEKE